MDSSQMQRISEKVYIYSITKLKETESFVE